MKSQILGDLSGWWEINRPKPERRPLRVLSLGVDGNALDNWGAFATHSLKFTGVDPRREVILASVEQSSYQWIESTFDEFTLYYDEEDNFSNDLPNWELVIIEEDAMKNENAIDFAFSRAVLWVVVVQSLALAEGRVRTFTPPTGEGFDEFLIASDDFDPERCQRVTVWERI